MSCIDVTLSPLAPNRPLLLVAAVALIETGGCVLLAQRPPGKSMAGLWEFPGGKVNAGEIPEAALVRELREELGIETSTGCLWPLTFASHSYEHFHLLMPLFSCRVWQGAPQSLEEQKLVWVRKDELRNYEMPPADVGLVQALWELL
jgi:8-oxo-dGTP diphosphatase